MNLSSRSHAIILLTVAFGKSDAKPLSIKEWARLYVWLKDHKLDPARLLERYPKETLSGFSDRTITLQRIECLLERGGSLGFNLDKWQRSGLWTITRTDAEYPERLKLQLRFESPPVLFGCGNIGLLARGGLGVVGSRNANVDDIAFSEHLGRVASEEGLTVVSGAARGVDEGAMLGALRSEGTSVGVVAHGLLRMATSVKFRKHLASGDLVLVSPYNPEAGFNVGNAMSRNKYIYCLSDKAVVVSSTPNKGGTWNGAVENLSAEWVPLLVKRNSGENSGNSALVRKGANWLPDLRKAYSLNDFFAESRVNKASENQPDSPTSNADINVSPERNAAAQAVGPEGSESSRIETVMENYDIPKTCSNAEAPEAKLGFYDLFITRMHEFEEPHKAEEIAQFFELSRAQVNTWLKQGVDDGKIQKLSRPVRFQSAEGMKRQQSLFEYSESGRM